MVKEHCRKKCLGCRQWFIPDPRTQGRQRFCSKPGCKKASKKWRQARWRVKPENRHYWRGSDEVKRVREWRKHHCRDALVQVNIKRLTNWVLLALHQF